jgi:hypothetical protein
MSARSLSYKNVPQGKLNEFRTSRPSASLGFGATWLPHLTTPRLGLSVEGQYGARVRAATEDDSTYELSSNEVVGSALVGIPLSWGAIDLMVGGGIHQNKVVSLDDPAPPQAPLPDVSYQFLRAGLGIHVYTSSPFSLVAAGSYRHILGAGDIASEDWFPHLKVYGLDALLGAAYRIAPWLEARVQVDGRLYRYHMNSIEGEPRVAGGAVDQYLGAWLGVAGLFGG